MGLSAGKFAVFMDWLSDWFPWLFSKNGLDIGPIPAGHAGGPVDQSLPFVSDGMRFRSGLTTSIDCGRLGKKAAKDLKVAEQAPQGKRGITPGRSTARTQQMPRFYRQSWPLFRHQLLQGQRRAELGDDDKWAVIEF